MKKLLIALLVCAGIASAQSYRAVTVTIADEASLSGAADLKFCSPVRLEWTTAQDSAVNTFQISEDGTNYRNFYDEYGTEITIPAHTGSRIIRLNPSEWWNLRYLKIRSGTAASAVNQTTAAVSIKIVCQMVYPQ